MANKKEGRNTDERLWVGQPALVLHVWCPQCREDREVVFTSVVDKPLSNKLGECVGHNGVHARYLEFGQINMVSAEGGVGMAAGIQDPSLNLFHIICTLGGVYREKFGIPLPDAEILKTMASRGVEIIENALENPQDPDFYYIPGELMKKETLEKLREKLMAEESRQRQMITDKWLYDIAIR